MSKIIFKTINLTMRKSLSSGGLRAVLMVLLVAFGVGNAWASSSKTYYSKMNVAVASGQTGYGTVYVTSSGKTSDTKNSSASSAPTHTYNIYATANAGYKFTSWSGSGITFGSSTTANTTGAFSASSTSSGSPTSKTATASFEVIQATAAPANIDLAPTDPSAIYPVETSERTLTFTTSTSNALTDFTYAPANGASGKYTFANWRRVDATHVAVDYTFAGGGNYGGLTRTHVVDVTLKGKEHATTQKCTITATFPNAKITDGSADEVFATYKSTDATQEGVAKTAVFDVEYVDGTNNFDIPTFTGADASHFAYNSMSYADGKLTVNYTYNGNKENGTHTATLTLKVNNAIGGTDATYGSKAITITAHNEEEATDDVSVTTAANVTTNYATFAAGLAAANASSGCTLKLLRNVDLGTITATNNINKAMTIDLNGKELRAAVNAKQVGVLTVNANVVVTIKDSKTGGRIINEYGKDVVLYTINVAQGTLNLESGTISIHNTLQQSYGTAAAGGVATSVVSMGARAIQQAAATTVNINGGRVESYGTRAVYGIRTEGSKANNTTLNISGGEIYAESPAYVYAVFSNGKLNVSGGTITAKINNEVVNENTAYMEYIRTNNKLWDNRTYGLRGFGYGILLQGGNSVTANANYFGTLNMTGGTVNVINVGDPEMQANSTVTSIIQSPLYGVYFNAAALNVKTGTASDGSYSQKYAAKGSITGGTVNVTNNGRQSYGVWVTGNYNSFDNSYAPVELKNCTINVSSYYESYGVYATAVVGTTSDNASPNMGACYAGEVELTGATVTAETTTAATAYALFAHAVVGNVYKNATWTKAKNAGYPRVYDGEFGAAAKITVNSGTYTATSATTTAYAVGSTTRAKTTLSSETSVAANRELGGNAEAYPVLILHGGTFRGETGTTTSGAVLSGGYTTIDGGTYTAYSGSTTSRGIYATAGTLDVSNVEISASGTTTAYGIDLSCGISDYTGFKYFADATLKNLTVTATTRTGNEADAVLMEVTKRPLSTTTYNALTSANKTNYGAIYQYGEYAVGAKCSIIGGTYTAKSAVSTAYGVRMNSAAICEDVNGDGELAIGAAELNINNATFEVEAKTGSSAYGIWAGGPATIDNSTFTVKTSTSDAFGIRPRYGKTTINNSTINVTAGTATARGFYVDALMSAISTSNNTTHYCGVQGFEIKGELESNNNTVTVRANGGNTAYGIQVISAKGQATQTTADAGLAFKGDHACAGNAVINGGKYTATASGTTAYAIIVSAPATQGAETAIPSCTVNDGKFYGYATGGTYADLSPDGEPGYFVLNGGYYVKDENIDVKLGEGMNKVAVKSGTPEYNDGYRWRVTDNMTGEIVCKVYEGTTLKQSYQSLEEALAYVNLPDNSSKTQTIVMCGNYTLSSGDYELPANKTLLVPYKSGQTSAVGTSPSWVNVNNYTYSTPTPYCKLTFAEGVNMTVKGKIEASAQTYVSNTGLTTIGTAVVANTYGWIYLNEGSYVDLESGSSLQAWGYITGKGEINAKNGSYIYEDFQLGDWRGGTMASSIRGNTNGLNSKGVFLVTHYYYQNIEAPVIYRPGATAQAYSGCYMKYVGNAVTDEPVTMVGTSNAMFLMDPATAGDNTWVRKEYDPSTDYMNWTMNSGASLGSITLSVYVEVNSKDYVLPITSNFNIVANYGDITITNDVCFIPGSKLTIKKEGSVTIPSNTRVFFYDYDDWSSYSGKFFKPYYSPSWKFNPRTTIGDAMVKIEGTLNLQGVGYTTAHGANICSTRENAGKIIFGSAAPASTEAIAAFTGNSGKNKTLCQLVGNGSEGQYAGKALNSIWLKNEDGSYSKTGQDEGGANTPANKTWIYMEDDDHVYRWILSYEDGCFTYKNNGSGDKQLIHPSDWVAVESNANGDHAYHSEDGTRMFINAKATTANKSCVWWEVDPTPEVISGTTYYVANNDYFDNYGTYFYWDNSVSYWKPKKVTVIWKDKDGNKIANGSYGDLYSFNTSPQFFGANPVWANTSTEKHDWIGWRDAEGNIYDKNATLPVATGDVTYTAYFQTSKYQYTITFKNEDDNKVIWAGLMDAGDPAVCPVEPTQESTVSTVYTFSNWVGYAVNATLPTITGPATYTAHYTTSTRQYHVTFYNYDAATVLFETDVDYNTRPVYGGVTPFRANTSAFSYEWTGWQQGANTYDTDDDLAFVTGDVYYVATFSQTDLKYQVLFKRQDGSIIDAPFFNFEETPAAFPANPTLASTVSTDYTFDHWDPATLQPVTVDGMVYTAHFSESPRQYTAHFVNYDGTSLGVDQTIDYNTVPAYTGATPFKPNDSRNSFEFAGWAWEAGADWDAGSIGVGEAFPAIKGDITFTAQFTETLLQFNIIYKREDGTVIEQQKKKWGESTAFPSVSNYEDATHTYTFDHWSPATVVTPVTTDATYTAYFNQGVKTYSISNFSISPAGYGTVSPASVTGIPSGSSVTVNGNMITVNGQTITATPTAADAQYTYTFDHWNNVPATVTANVTNIEAVFTRTTRTYTVTWKNGDATLETDENVAYGATPHYDGATPTKAADAEYTYTFNGWSPDVSSVTGNATYTATYTSTANVASVAASGTPTTYHATVADAISAANGKTNAVVTMLQNASVTSKITISAAMTIDLNGKTITSTIATKETGTFYINASDKTVTIRDNGTGGKIYQEVSCSGGYLYGIHVYAGTLTIESGTIYTKNTANKRANGIYTSDNATAINILTGGKIETVSAGQAFGIYAYNSCALTIDGGTVTVNGSSSVRGIYVKGKTDLTNATIESTASDTDSRAIFTNSGVNLTINSGTYTASGTSDCYAIYERSGTTLTINGGRFSGVEKEIYKDGGSIAIKGGVYKHDTDIQGYCAENYHVLDLTSGADYDAGYRHKVAEAYTVTFMNGSTQLQSGYVGAGVQPLYAGTPSKDPDAQYTYSFDGWSTTDGGDKLASLPVVSANATYYAHYEKTEQKYTVAVAAGAHGAVSPASVSNIGCETASGDIKATPDAGYSFSSWTLPEGVTPADGFTASSNPIHIHATAAEKTITANFAARTDINYTVRHFQQNIADNNYTEVTADAQTLHGTTATATNAVAKNYTGFTAQAFEQGIVAGDGSTVVEIYYDRITYTITWKNGDNTIETDQDVKYGATPSYDGAIPTQTQTEEWVYTHDSWTPAVETVTANATYTATFSQEKRKYNVTWTGESVIERTDEVAYGDTPCYGVEPTKVPDESQVYTFKWMNISNAEIGVKPVTCDVTYAGSFTGSPRPYTITFVNDNGVELQSSQVTYGSTPTYEETPASTKTDGTYNFIGWTPEIVAVSGAATYTATYEKVLLPVVVNQGEAETISVQSSTTTTIVEDGGILTVENNAKLTTVDLVLEATPSTSGEIIAPDEQEALVAHGTVTFKFSQPGGFKARTWYSVAVPWQVDVPHNAPAYTMPCDIYAKSGDGEFVRLNLGSTIDLLYYDGDERANHGPSDKCWKYVEDDGQNEVMMPGTAYMFMLLNEADTICFVRKNGTPLRTRTTNVVSHDSETTENQNWNGIANPATYHAYLDARGNAGDVILGYIYDGDMKNYKIVDMDTTKLVVGQAVYIQAPTEQTIVANPIEYDNPQQATNPAPRRVAANNRVKRYDVFLGTEEDNAVDRVIVRTDEDKEDEYVIAKDLIKFDISPKVAQIWANGYDDRLAMNTVAPVNDQAIYPLGIFIPQAGEYNLYVANEMAEDDNLYLTYDGRVIWNLGYAPYVLSLEKGVNEHYGLRLIHNTPGMEMDVDQVEATRAAQKMLIDQKVYILRGEQLYSITGQKAE